jgi:flavin reductase (DIM6/NTAB) family NADH-FMN oxidoreductase RutF
VGAALRGQPAHGDRRLQEGQCHVAARLRQPDRLLRATFQSGPGLGEDPFLGLRTVPTPNGCPVPASALGWLECDLAFNLDLEAECGLYVGRVRDGEILSDA